MPQFYIPKKNFLATEFVQNLNKIDLRFEWEKERLRVCDWERKREPFWLLCSDTFFSLDFVFKISFMPKSNIDTSPKNVPNIFSLGIIAAAILLSLHGAIFGKRSHGLVIKNGSSLGTKASSFCRKTIFFNRSDSNLQFFTRILIKPTIISY